MNGLTKRQVEVLNFIEDWIRVHKFSPTYREIEAGVGIRSKSVLHRLLHNLAKRGAITMLPRQARSIRVNHQPLKGDKDG